MTTTSIARSRLSYGLAVVALIGALFGSGYYFGSQTADAHSIQVDESTVNLKTFWRVWQILDAEYPDADKVTTQERVWGAIKGLTASFNDPYTVYFEPTEAKQFDDSISGEFGGVGMEIGIRDTILTVIAPIKDTPSYKAGIKAGDKILEIDGETTEDMTVDEAISKIRGEKGTTVVLSVFTEGDKEARTVSIVRDTIVIPSLETKVDKGIFTISFYSFSAKSASDFANALNEFKRSNATKLIIDLRSNPGGYLDAAIDVASWFVDQGQPVVIEDFGDPATEHVYRSKGFEMPKKPRKIVVLVDGGSASASEIVAGALQEYELATLVGETTYGKGSVQEVIRLDDKSAVKVTIAKWLTPKRVSISEKGVTPDVVVDVSKAKEGQDLIMEKALEILK